MDIEPDPNWQWMKSKSPVILSVILHCQKDCLERCYQHSTNVWQNVCPGSQTDFECNLNSSCEWLLSRMYQISWGWAFGSQAFPAIFKVCYIIIVTVGNDHCQIFIFLCTVHNRILIMKLVPFNFHPIIMFLILSALSLISPCIRHLAGNYSCCILWLTSIS
jgi:hypothetical protein